MLIKNYNKFKGKAEQLAINDNISISTFGISGKQIEFLSKYKNVRIIVGTNFSECTENCNHCRSAFKRRLWYFEKLREDFPNISFKFVTKLHLKCFITSEGMVIGGMNLTGSSWDDLAYFIDDKVEILEAQKYFDDLWSKKDEVDLEIELNASERTSSWSKKKTSKITNDNTLNFGKYKGKTIAEIIEIDRNYINWCKEKNIFDQKELQLIEVVEKENKKSDNSTHSQYKNSYNSNYKKKNYIDSHEYEIDCDIGESAFYGDVPF